jgi:protein O-GlcNAc transferase
VFCSGAEINAYCRELERSLESLRSIGLATRKPDRLPTLRAKPRDDATSLDEIVATGAIPGFALSYHAMNYRRLKQRFADLYAPQFSHLAPARGMARSHPPRIGILITRRYEGVFLRCMSGIIDRLDRKRFEIVVLYSRPRMARVQAGLSCAGLRFVPFDGVFTRAVAQVRAAACDLIYYWEVGSDPLNYFLPFARLAPIQCTSHGSLTTTGVPTIDYFYTSSLVEPDGSSEHYSERLWISKTLLMYKDRLAALKQLPRAHWGLRDDRHIYACLQNPVKLHPDFDALLAGILSADPRATIVLLSDPHGNAASALRRRFANSIAGATDRIVFVPRQNFPDYCALLQSADVLLDPLHYGAGSSCYDVFSFNLPMVTMPTEMMPGRVALAFYRKMQFEELVATSHDDYICKAVRVATDRDYRQYVTERIAATSDVLFNDVEAVREHERFFEETLARVGTG